MSDRITDTANRLSLEGGRFVSSPDLSRHAQDSFQPQQSFQRVDSGERHGAPEFLDLNSNGLYDSPMVLKAHISNVPEISEPVKLEEVPQYLNRAFAAGAQAVHPIEEWMTRQNAVTDTLISIGPVLDNAVTVLF